jgi:hypothetical protein
MSSQCRDGLLFAILTLLPISSVPAQERSASRKSEADKPVVAVTHRPEEDDDGWRIAETANFRLYHRHARSLAEALLENAERTRAAQQKKWFGEVGSNWSPKCRIFLYPSAEAYTQATGAPLSPGGGQTDVQAEDGRVRGRCIHLHGTRTFLLRGVVPHEVTHAVLAGRLGDQRVPRWADEGMAILAEAQPHIDVHFRTLPRWRADEALFRIRTLVEMHDYPQPRSIGVFYAQSVSLVDFLTREKGPKRFADFVREGQRDGYAASLRKHYGWNFAELERRWQRYTFDRARVREETIIDGGS